jgi:hypothetical protein
MENFPEMAQQFRLVNYNNLLIYIIYIPVGGWNMNCLFPYIGTNNPNQCIYIWKNHENILYLY